MVTGIHHVGIAVKSLATAYRFWRDTLGLPLTREAEVTDQGVRAALLAAGDSEIELLEPTRPDTGIARFLDRHGEGLHHLCFLSAAVDSDLAVLRAKKVPLLDTTPREGLAGRIAFLSPKACDGVLVELATPSSDEPPTHASPLGLKRLVLGAQDVKQTAGRFQALFGFAEVAMNDGPRTMLGVGKGALLVVPAAEVGGTEGMVALSLVAEDFSALTTALRRAGTPRLEGTAEVSIEPTGSHGVHLHISRYNFP